MRTTKLIAEWNKVSNFKIRKYMFGAIQSLKLDQKRAKENGSSTIEVRGIETKSGNPELIWIK